MSVKHFLIFSILLCLGGMNFIHAQTTLFVKTSPSGNGDGSSWDDAYDGTLLGDYLKNTAVAGTKIYVAAGTYYPTITTDRTASFELKVAVELYGGFPASATGTVPGNTDYINNVTRLSGDIGTTGLATDNSYRVVIYNNSGATLSGFYISDGYGDGTGLNNDGAGIFCAVSNTTGELSNLIVEKNVVIAPGSTNGDGCGGGIYIAKSVKCQFNNIIVRKNTATTGNTSYGGTGAGGGIFVTGEAVSCMLINSLVEENTATRVGGGICAEVALTLEETTISGNNAGTSGGGVYASAALTLNRNLVFKDNIAQTQGGAIWKNIGAFTTTGAVVEITGNKAVTGTGGGIHSGITFSADGWTITGNQSGSTGGGIHTTTGVGVELANSSVTGNTASGNGGGIYASGPLTLSGNNTISGNKAGWTGSGYATTGAYHGGGIYAANGFTLKGALICNGNGATGDGGGIYKSTTGIFTATELTSLELDGNGAGLGAATVSGSGGGMYTAVDIDLGNLTTGIISNNKAKPYYPGNSTARGGGGGIFAGKTLVLKNVVINNNSVAGTVIGTGVLVTTGLGIGGGGGIFTAGVATLDNVTVINNTSTTAQSSYSTSGGGGICAASTFTLNNATVSKNTSSTTGGGILANSYLTLNNTVVNNNTATTTGGGIHVISASITLNNSKVNNNRAAQEGGGIYSASIQSAISMPLALNSTTVKNNTAGRSGGGIYAKSNLVLTGNDTISYNIAGWTGTAYSTSTAYHGGGIHVSDYSLVLSDTLICKGNVATGNGGGIYKTYSSNGTIAFTVTNLKLLEVDDNESKAAGGGIYTHNSLDLSKLPKGSSISGNKAGTTGGGIRTDGTSATNDGVVLLKLGNLTINYNTAAREGGGIYASGQLTLSGNNTVSHNKAGWTGSAYSATAYAGGGIYTKSGLILIDTLVCKGNSASGNGGGIYKATTTTSTYYSTAFTVTDLKLLQVEDNESKSSGGGIYTSDILELSNLQEVSIRGNKAATTGGGIYAGNALTLGDVVVNNNAAKSHGGGIYSVGTLTLSDQNNISDNKAGWDGAAFVATTAYGGGVCAINNLILSGTLICNNNAASSYGGGIYKSSATVAINTSGLNVLQLNNNAAGKGTTGGGGGAYLGGSATIGADFSNAAVEIVGNKAAGVGGGIYSVGTLSLKNAIVSNNSTTSSGGGIYATNALTLDDMTISGNKAGWNGTAYSGAYSGGGIYAVNSLALKGAIVCDQDSAAQHGGGIYISANAGFITTDLQSLTITNCCADAGKISATNGNGGAICFNGSTTVSANTGNLSVTLGKSGVPVVITGNRASQGGAIFWPANNTAASTSSLTIQNVDFSGNTSWGSGGAIWIGGNNAATASNMPVTLADVTMSGNKSGWNYITNAWVTTGAGGAVQLDNNKIDFILKGNVVFDNNETGNAGGAICVNTNITAGSTITGTVSNGLTSLKIMGNIARGTSGGGIHTSNANVSITLEDVTITDNTAKTNGGGIYAFGTLTLGGNNTISGNKAGYDITSGFYSGNNSGGGIYANNALTISGSLVCNNNNTSQYGGGIYKSVTNNFEASSLTSLQVDGNGAGKGVTTGAGGGIYTLVALNLDNLTTGSSISDNTAVGTGGGLHLAKGAMLNNINISNNSSGGGGAIAFAATLETDTLKLRGDIVFYRNSVVDGATGQNKGGGAIAITAVTKSVIFAAKADGLKSLMIDSCYVKGASHDGGAISTFSNSNTAVLILKGGSGVPITIRNCSAERNAGGIQIIGHIELEGVLFENNKAGSNASAIFRTNSSVVDKQSIISGCAFKGNSGSPAVINMPTGAKGTAAIINSTFYKNSSTGNVITTGITTNISFSTFYGNTVTYSVSGTSTFNGNIVQDKIGQQAIPAGVTGSYNIMGFAADTTRLGAGKNNIINTDLSSLFDNIVTGEPQLVDNGTIPPTFNIKEGSIAHNFIPNNVFYPWNGNVRGTDQRSLPRPFGCKTDAGAVELQVEKPITITAEATEACTGDEVLFTGETGFATYSWSSVGGTPRGAATTIEEYFKWATSGQKAVLLTVTDGYGCENTGSKDIDILLRSETGPLYRLPNLQ